MELNNWREKFNNRAGSMYDFSIAEGISFSTESLIPFAHWITPEMMPKRFDTRFYIAQAPEGHEGEHDGNESVDSLWIAPKDALEDCYNKKKNYYISYKIKFRKT